MFDATRDGPGRDSDNSGLRVVAERNSAVSELIGASPTFIAVLKDVRTVTPVNCPVLIRGTTGTGSEVIARVIHDASARRQHRFVQNFIERSVILARDTELRAPTSEVTNRVTPDGGVVRTLPDAHRALMLATLSSDESVRRKKWCCRQARSGQDNPYHQDAIAGDLGAVLSALHPAREMRFEFLRQDVDQRHQPPLLPVDVVHACDLAIQLTLMLILHSERPGRFNQDLHEAKSASALTTETASRSMWRFTRMMMSQSLWNWWRAWRFGSSAALRSRTALMIDWGRQTAQALAAAHQGISFIVKAENLMVAHTS